VALVRGVCGVYVVLAQWFKGILRIVQLHSWMCGLSGLGRNRVAFWCVEGVVMLRLVVVYVKVVWLSVQYSKEYRAVVKGYEGSAGRSRLE